MTRPISVTIDIRAMRGNLQRMRSVAGERVLWAVVKANAYGHGLSNAVAAFTDADGLATIEVSEAIRLRRLGWTKRILLLEGFFDEEDVRLLEMYDIETNVHSEWQIAMLYRTAPHTRLKTHIKVNSGMNRLGFPPSLVSNVSERLASISGCHVLGIVTHFANADPTYNGAWTVRRQLECLGGLAHSPGACLSNSAAILFHPEVTASEVRAGVVLYGLSPDSRLTNEEFGIEPAMTLSAGIIAIQDVAAGEAVGYGSRWLAKRNSRIAVVACGYADGYPRSMPDGVPTWISGKIAPLAGAVSMDMLTIDVTDVPEAEPGMQVELWGKHIRVNDLAQACGTIGYELICALAPRVPVVVSE